VLWGGRTAGTVRGAGVQAAGGALTDPDHDPADLPRHGRATALGKDGCVEEEHAEARAEADPPAGEGGGGQGGVRARAPCRARNQTWGWPAGWLRPRAAPAPSPSAVPAGRQCQCCRTPPVAGSGASGAGRHPCMMLAVLLDSEPARGECVRAQRVCPRACVRACMCKCTRVPCEAGACTARRASGAGDWGARLTLSRTSPGSSGVRHPHEPVGQHLGGRKGGGGGKDRWSPGRCRGKQVQGRPPGSAALAAGSQGRRPGRAPSGDGLTGGKASPTSTAGFRGPLRSGRGGRACSGSMPSTCSAGAAPSDISARGRGTTARAACMARMAAGGAALRVGQGWARAPAPPQGPSGDLPFCGVLRPVGCPWWWPNMAARRCRPAAWPPTWKRGCPLQWAIGGAGRSRKLSNAVGWTRLGWPRCHPGRPGPAPSNRRSTSSVTWQPR
jgi:hypothetical protein